MRIASDGHVIIGRTTRSSSTPGVHFSSNGQIVGVRGSDYMPILIDKMMMATLYYLHKQMLQKEQSQYQVQQYLIMDLLVHIGQDL
jgi:hypothetical protein